MSVDTATVRKVAGLARIAISDGEAEALVPELNNILGWIEQLQEVAPTTVEPMTAVILSNRCRVPPFGLEGGAPGAAGANWVERDGSKSHESFGARHRTQMNPGDVFVIQTPGGGGFGVKAVTSVQKMRDACQGWSPSLICSGYFAGSAAARNASRVSFADA